MRLSTVHAFVVALALAPAGFALAQSPEKPAAPPPPHPGMMGGGMMGHGMGMTPEQCKERVAAMRASDEELDKLVAAMKSAKGEAKVDATAAVVEKMAEQHKKMHPMLSEEMCERMKKPQ